MDEDFEYDIYDVDTTNIRTDSYQDALADLTRQQFEDYKNRFLPVQEELFGLATSDKLLNEQCNGDGPRAITRGDSNA